MRYTCANAFILTYRLTLASHGNGSMPLSVIHSNLHANDLPMLASISQFSAYFYDLRMVEPRSIAILAAKFPNLRSLDMSLSDDEKKDIQLAQKLHYGTPATPLLLILCVQPRHSANADPSLPNQTCPMPSHPSHTTLSKKSDSSSAITRR